MLHSIAVGQPLTEFFNTIDRLKTFSVADANAGFV